MATRPKSSISAGSRKDKFPLSFHRGTGQFFKKVNGRFHYFGKDPDSALAEWLRVKDDLNAGRKPRERSQNGLTVLAMVNQFLTIKEQRVGSGELRKRSWGDYFRTCQRILRVFTAERLVEDLGPDDFIRLRADAAQTMNPNTLANEIGRVRVCFNWAYENAEISKPVQMGQSFAMPSKKSRRIHRAQQGPKFFTSNQIYDMISESDGQLRAMILLGINCGFGNNDCGTLPRSAVDLQAGWLSFNRPKTGLPRRCKLWPETVEALRAVEAKQRGRRIDFAAVGLVFVTKYGGPWSTDDKRNPISQQFAKLLRKLGHYRVGLSFYGLRHTYRTVADECMDAPAIHLTMGHEGTHISASYIEHIANERLERIANHVRTWLFGAEVVQ